LIVVFTTKLVIVTAQRISTLRNTRRHNRSPISPEDASSAAQALNVTDVKVENKFGDCHEGVIGVGPCVAALHGLRRVALADRWRGRRRRGILGPSYWSGGGGDAARRGESYDERNEGFVEQHCGDEW